MKLSLEKKGVKEVQKAVKKMPAHFEKARLSALKSLGWYGQKILRGYLETGSGFAPLHPLSAAVAKGRGNTWRKRRAQSPLDWLGKFARYVVSPDKKEMRIGLGKNKTELHKGMMEWLKKHEYGSVEHVTPEMKDLLKPGLLLAGLKPLSSSTSTIKIPRRVVMAKVFQIFKPKAVPWFNKKFWKNYQKVAGGGTLSTGDETS